MGEILSWILMASGVIVLTLVMREILKRKVKKVWINALWLIVLVRLLVPILPSSAMSLFNLWGRIDSISPIVSNENTVVDTELEAPSFYFVENEAVFPKIEKMSQEKAIPIANNYLTNSISKQPILFVLWFVGIIVVLGYFIIGYYQIKKKINQLEVVKDKETLALLAKLKEMLHIKAEIKLVKGEYPFIFGLSRPVICVSDHFTREDAQMMLLHELMHFKYKDNVLTYLHIAALAVHWFNPLVWIAIKLMKHDMELACDERVLGIGTNKKQYANTLLKVALTPQKEIYWVQGMGENTKQIKTRLLLIATFKEPKASFTIIGVILLIIGGIVCLTNAQQPKLPTAAGIEALQDVGQQQDNLSREEIWKNSSVKNIAILGLDESQLRTDTIMVVNLDKGEDALKVISIPRDTKVIWDDKEKVVGDVPVPNILKINQLYGFTQGENAGKLVVKEIERLLSIEIDDIIIVDFKSIEKVVDALGGINIELMQDMMYTDHSAGLYINLKKGQQQLNGEQTLQAIRYRMYPDGDLGRISVQQQIMEVMLDKIFAESNVSQLLQVVSEVFNGIQTSISAGDIPSYIQMVLATRQNQIHFYTLPGQGSFEEGVSYFVPDHQQSTSLFH